MSTNREVVTAALRMVGVLDANETAQIEDAMLALGELNDLFSTLEADGIDLGYPPQSNLADTFPLDAVAEAQIKPLLAAQLLTHYPSARPTDSLPIRVRNAMTQLELASVLANTEEVQAAIPRGSGFYSDYDISTGE
jgi:hypothetical protein